MVITIWKLNVVFTQIAHFPRFSTIHRISKLTGMKFLSFWRFLLTSYTRMFPLHSFFTIMRRDLCWFSIKSNENHFCWMISILHSEEFPNHISRAKEAFFISLCMYFNVRWFLLYCADINICFCIRYNSLDTIFAFRSHKNSSEQYSIVRPFDSKFIKRLVSFHFHFKTIFLSWKHK